MTSKIPKRSQPILLTWWIPNENKKSATGNDPIRPISNRGPTGDVFLEVQDTSNWLYVGL